MGHPQDELEYAHHADGGKGAKRTLRGYRNPFRKVRGLHALRIDMGVDYSTTADSPVYAIGFGRVVRCDSSSSWPGGHFIAIRFTRGRAKGKVYYLAEHLTFPKGMKVGRRVRPWTRIATLHPGYPYCETGWSKDDPPTFAPLAYGCYSEGERTAAGDNFSDFLHAIGAPRGVIGGRSTHCPLPGNWPRKW